MKHTVEIIVRDSIVRVVSAGEVEFDRTTQAMKDAARLAKENDFKAILFDIRDAIYREYHVTAIEHAKMARDVGIEPQFNVAVLGRAGSDMLMYVENVAINRGLSAKSFTSESEALDWDRKRAKLIPCEAYRALVAGTGGRSTGWTIDFQKLDLPHRIHRVGMVDPS